MLFSKNALDVSSDLVGRFINHHQVSRRHVNQLDLSREETLTVTELEKLRTVAFDYQADLSVGVLVGEETTKVKIDSCHA
ncbi:hypothetical protein D3C71_1772880 [compost metagenome]